LVIVGKLDLGNVMQVYWQKLKSLFSVIILSMFGNIAFADLPRFNMHYGVTSVSRDIFDLHMTIFWICVAIGIVVFGVLFYSLIMHRKSRGFKPAQFHEHPILEIIWAIVPLVILVIMAIPATLVLIKMDNTDNATITIKITGFQWKWKYDYLDQGISFFSSLKTPYAQIYNQEKKGEHYLLEVDKELVVPINEKIRFLITANDVIHSWWVPQLGVKKDAIPGFIHETWAKIDKPGIYRGQCAELCGVNHGFMPIVVKAVTKAEFDQWVIAQRGTETKQQDATMQPVDQKTYTANELMKMGETDYNKYCSACHQINGMGVPPIYPALKASSVVVGRSIDRHINKVLKGVPGTAMQAFATQLSDTEIAAIVTYERNAWGNHTGDVVQPAMVAAERAKSGKKTEQQTQQNEKKDIQQITKPQQPSTQPGVSQQKSQ
jgi:cytochrome c oxidase subunit II